MRRTLLSLTLALALGACGGSDEPTTQDEASTGAEAPADEAQASAEAPEPTRTLEDGSRLFGAELSEREAVELSAVLADPSQFDGQVVKTTGEISAVCQSMGCWMEIRTDADSPGVRVPMANHAFFLPRDLAGARATIEGTVTVAELDAETREHLESEGAQAAGSDISIEASGVLVHP